MEPRKRLKSVVSCPGCKTWNYDLKWVGGRFGCYKKQLDGISKDQGPSVCGKIDTWIKVPILKNGLDPTAYTDPSALSSSFPSFCLPLSGNKKIWCHYSLKWMHSDFKFSIYFPTNKIQNQGKWWGLWERTVERETV